MPQRLAATFAVVASTLVACSAASAPDRCISVDAGQGRYEHSPKYEVCLPDKAVHSPSEPNTNSIRVVNGYDGNWMTSGVYELTVHRDAVSPQSIQKSQEQFVSMMGMREVDSGQRKIYYRQKNRILDKLPEEAKKESFGISIFEARDDAIIVSIEAAVKRPKDFDKDPVGSIDRLVKRDVEELLKRIKVVSSPGTDKP